ncbi:MAG: CDP-alcohol phosphatidyltransferase family protein [Flavisolibacter sp.]|jgi:CDP-diacylglycerol--serine O-phosphatidyltransferase
MKQIPNIFTLINLVFGCIAIVLILQTGESIVVLDQLGASQVTLPEKIWQGSLFIFGAAIVDFLDGFLARLLKANSEKGKQLDSLCDVVSFGVAPGMILYQLLRIGYAKEEGGLDVSIVALLPAFIYSCAVAWRLAKFNISTNQTYNFRGVPCPAAGLLVASFPLIIWYQYFGVQQYFINVWLLYAVILIVSYLMISNRSFMAMKFTDYSFKNNLPKYLLVFISLVCIVVLKWLAVPVIFILYLIFSAFAKEPPHIVADTNRATLDVTV